MPQLLPDKITTLTYPSLRDAMRKAEPTLRPESRLLLVAMIAHETGLKSCHWHNLGNAKSLPSDTCDSTMFPCGEELTATQAARWKAELPVLVSFVGQPYQRNGVTMQSVRLIPPHPATAFRAYRTLSEGVRGYLALVKSERYRSAWAAVVAGDVEAFVRELGAHGYFTAGVDVYLAGVKRRLVEARGALSGYKTLRFDGKDDPESLKNWREDYYTRVPTELAFMKSEAAKWQKEHGLTPDGIVGNTTWGTLLAEIGAEVDA